VIIRNNLGRGRCYQPSRRPGLITPTEILVIQDVTKTESNDCFIKHCFEEQKEKHTVVRKRIDIMHCVRNLQISQLSQGGKEFYVTRDGTQIIRVMRDRAQISRVRRDLD